MATRKKAQKPQKAKNKGGRPKKDIDTDQVFKLAQIACTDEEIGDILGCHRETLALRFSDTLKRGRSHGKMSVRRAQFLNATEHNNVTAQIWLGKNWLGQRDRFDEKPEQEQSVDQMLEDIANEHGITDEPERPN